MRRHVCLDVGMSGLRHVECKGREGVRLEVHTPIIVGMRVAWIATRHVRLHRGSGSQNQSNKENMFH
jgi:hypothetical protein